MRVANIILAGSDAAQFQPSFSQDNCGITGLQQIKESIGQCASLVKLEGPDEHLPGGYINASYIQTYGQLRVINKSLSYNQHSVCKRLFEVHNLQDTNPPHILVHYEYLGWPDHKSTQLVRELVRELCKITPTAGPFVGHCSAGIGRSVTYCTIDHTLRRVIHADLTAVDLQRTVLAFRQQRDSMVETRHCWLDLPHCYDWALYERTVTSILVPFGYHFCYKAVVEELEDYLASQRRT